MANKDGFDGLAEDGQITLGKGVDQSTRITAEFEAELARLRQSMLYTNREVGTLTTGIGSGLRRAFEGLAFDGLKLSDALKGIARSMAVQVVDLFEVVQVKKQAPQVDTDTEGPGKHFIEGFQKISFVAQSGQPIVDRLFIEVPVQLFQGTDMATQLQMYLDSGQQFLGDERFA